MAEQTYHDGANQERRALRAFLRRRLKAATDAGAKAALTEALEWVKGRARRYRAKQGGL